MLQPSKEKIYEDPEAGKVRFRKSLRSSRVSIRIHPARGVTVTIPYFTSYDTGMRFYLAKREWVLAAITKQKSSREQDPALSPEQIEELRRVAKSVLPKKLAILAERYGFQYNRIAVKHNTSNWGSCSVRNNINLNLHLVRLPEALCDYVILHELCHLRHRDHGPQFHALLEQLCTDNMARLEAKNDPDTVELLARIRSSRASQPVRHTLEQSLRHYRLQ